MMTLLKSFFSLFAILALAIHSTSGANILGLFTSHSQSHLIVHMSVAKALAAKGHNVTVITGLKPKTKAENVTIITILPSDESFKKLEDFTDELSSKEQSPLKMIANAFSGGLTCMVDMQMELLESEQFKSFYNKPDTHFDLVIVGYFMNEFMLGVAAKYNCPVVVSWSGPPLDIVNTFVGNPAEIAYVPNVHLQVNSGSVLTFVERLKNMLGAAPMAIVAFVLELYTKNFYKQYFGHLEHFRPLDEARRNVSLLLVNSHFSEGPIRPNVPAMIEIGGIQVKDKPDPLPRDIEEFLNKSKKHGVIYFCLGTNLKMSTMDPEKLKIIFDTLAARKENVIWKWNDLQNLPGKSKNILYKDWLPQDDVLAHPNIKLFITHAGKGGVVEAQHHGVPMLAMPFFADQHSNAAKMVNAGYGISMKVSELTAESFKAGIDEMLYNPKYAEKIKNFSLLYLDRPMPAKDNAVFWLEYVIRHHGARHMQSPLVHLNFIQKTSMDTIAFLLLILYILFKIAKFMFMFFIRKIINFFTNSSEKQNKKKRQ